MMVVWKIPKEPKSLTLNSLTIKSESKNLATKVTPRRDKFMRLSFPKFLTKLLIFFKN